MSPALDAVIPEEETNPIFPWTLDLRVPIRRRKRLTEMPGRP
jgi:hypothetical protein